MPRLGSPRRPVPPSWTLTCLIRRAFCDGPLVPLPGCRLCDRPTREFRVDGLGRRVGYRHRIKPANTFAQNNCSGAVWTAIPADRHWRQNGGTACGYQRDLRDVGVPADPRSAQHAVARPEYSSLSHKPRSKLQRPKIWGSSGARVANMGSSRSSRHLCDRLIYAPQSCTENARLCRVSCARSGML